MSVESSYPSVYDRVSALFRHNMTVLGEQDVIVASSGGAGQSLLGHMLRELGLNYADSYTELLHPDGTTEPVAAHARWRRRLMAPVRDAPEPATERKRWPRFVKTEEGPGHLGDDQRLGGVWLLVRDPRDALYSRYRFRADFAKDPWALAAGDFGTWLTRRRPGGQCPVEEWTDFYADWCDEATRRKPGAVLRFEDIKSAPQATLVPVLRDFGARATGPDVARAAERSSFDAMRKHEDEAAGTGADAAADARILRRGTVDEWRRWITPELRRHFSGHRLRTVAGNLGYDLAETAGRTHQ